MSGQTNIIKNKLEGASSMDTRSSRKMLKPENWHVAYDTQYKKDESVNQWVNDKGACKTAMAKTGLLKFICCVLFYERCADYLWLVIYVDT